MLKKLTEAFGPSGCEDRVRDIIIKEISPFCTDISCDAMGNIIAYKKGSNSGVKLMVDAHIDEVGLIIKGITDEGYLKFDEVGGLDDRILPGKKVIIAPGGHFGVIGVKPLHLTTKDERSAAVKIKDMFIDIGAGSRDEALELVNIGDFACFDSRYTEFGDCFIKAKALDNRAGVFVLINLLKTISCPYDFYAVFSVQEEIGLRGAKVAAERLQPDFALILEDTICADGPDVPPHLQVTEAGKGVALSVMERTSLANREFLDFAIGIADMENIPYQFKRTGSGGNNAGAIQIAGKGVKTLAMAVPCRYLHSPACVINKKDLQAMENLAGKICERIDELCLKN